MAVGKKYLIAALLVASFGESLPAMAGEDARHEVTTATLRNTPGCSTIKDLFSAGYQSNTITDRGVDILYNLIHKKIEALPKSVRDQAHDYFFKPVDAPKSAPNPEGAVQLMDLIEKLHNNAKTDPTPDKTKTDGASLQKAVDFVLHQKFPELVVPKVCI